MNLSDMSEESSLRESQTFNSLEAPIILGVAVVGLLVGCALYHMCYRKLCTSDRHNRFFYSRNRGPSSAELRTRRSRVSEMFQQQQLEGTAGLKIDAETIDSGLIPVESNQRL